MTTCPAVGKGVSSLECRAGKELSTIDLEVHEWVDVKVIELEEDYHQNLCRGGIMLDGELVLTSTEIHVVLVLADSHKLSIQAGNGQIRGTFSDLGWMEN